MISIILYCFNECISIITANSIMLVLLLLPRNRSFFLQSSSWWRVVLECGTFDPMWKCSRLLAVSNSVRETSETGCSKFLSFRVRLWETSILSGSSCFMASTARGRSINDKRQNQRHAADSNSTEGASGSSSGISKFELVQKAFMAPFTHKKTDSTRILSDRMFL